MIVVRDREAGNVIDVVKTVEAGKYLIRQYEEQDKKDGTYTPDFYEVGVVDMKVYASKDLTRAIMVDDDFNIIKAYGLNNVLCCEACGLIETEELTETDKTDFNWSEEV